MNVTAIEIANLIDGIVEGNQMKMVTNVALFHEAQSTDLTYVRKQSELNNIATTEAGIILVPPVLSLPLGKTYIKVDCNPEQVMPKILTLFKQNRPEAIESVIHSTVQLAPSAVIGENVLIGKGTFIGANTVIADGAVIGENCIIHPGVIIGERVHIGANTLIQANAVIGSDSFEFVQMNNGTYEKLVNIGTVIIGDDVEIGANTTIDRGTIGNTVIGKGTKIDNLVQIGHEVHIGANCIIVSQVGIAGWTKIGNCTTIYGQSGIVGDIQIGSNVIVMGKSVVTKSIENNEIVSGNPAINHRQQLKLQASLKRNLK